MNRQTSNVCRVKRIVSAKLVLAFLSALFVVMSLPAYAATIDTNGTYRGAINSVAVNFWSGVGVGLSDGLTCNGQPVVILLYSDPHYKDMFTVLMSAKATGENVVMYKLQDVIQSYYGGVYAYCTITSVSLGNFPIW